MLNRRVSNLKISQGKYEGKPLLSLIGICDKSSSEFLYKTLINFLKNGHTKIFVDTRKLEHIDIKCNMVISSAHKEFSKAGGELKIISHSQPVSKAMKIIRKNRFASY